MGNKSRLLELDSLRGISALMVMISHYTWAYDFHFGLLGDHFFSFETGGAGVHLFFMISGFVIFMSLDKTEHIRTFIINRIIRLYPTYWVCMFITLFVITAFPVPTLGNFTSFEVLVNLTMVQGYLKVRSIDEVYWSLAIELIFYVIMTCLFMAKQLKRIELISIIWLSIVILSILIDYPLEKYIRIIGIINYAPLFIAGMMFYKIWDERGSFINHLLIFVSLLMHGYLLYESLNPVDLSFKNAFILSSFGYLGFYIFIYNDVRLFRTRWLVFFGTISYPLYLLHNIIGYAVIYRVRSIVDIQIVYCIAASIVAVLLSVLVHRYIENQSYRLKPFFLAIFRIKT